MVSICSQSTHLTFIVHLTESPDGENREGVRITGVLHYTYVHNSPLFGKTFIGKHPDGA
jgi:hypothetical protein